MAVARAPGGRRRHEDGISSFSTLVTDKCRHGGTAALEHADCRGSSSSATLYLAALPDTRIEKDLIRRTPGTKRPCPYSLPLGFAKLTAEPKHLAHRADTPLASSNTTRTTPLHTGQFARRTTARARWPLYSRRALRGAAAHHGSGGHCRAGATALGRFHPADPCALGGRRRGRLREREKET